MSLPFHCMTMQIPWLHGEAMHSQRNQLVSLPVFLTVFLADKEQMWRSKSLKLCLQTLVPKQPHDFFGSTSASTMSCMSYKPSLGVYTSRHYPTVPKIVGHLDSEIFLVMKKQGMARLYTIKILNCDLNAVTCFLLLPCRSDSSHPLLSIMRNESNDTFKWHIPISALECSYRCLHCFQLSFWGIWNIPNSFVFHEPNILSMKLSKKCLHCRADNFPEQCTLRWMVFVGTELPITNLCGCVTPQIT